MNRNRMAIIVAGGVVLSTMTACTERTQENMVPTGEVVEVEVSVPDTIPHPEYETPVIERQIGAPDIR